MSLFKTSSLFASLPETSSQVYKKIAEKKPAEPTHKDISVGKVEGVITDKQETVVHL